MGDEMGRDETCKPNFSQETWESVNGTIIGCEVVECIQMAQDRF